METRSSPSMEHLQNMMRYIDSQSLSAKAKGLSKPELHELIQSNVDVPRVERRLKKNSTFDAATSCMNCQGVSEPIRKTRDGKYKNECNHSRIAGLSHTTFLKQQSCGVQLSTSNQRELISMSGVMESSPPGDQPTSSTQVPPGRRGKRKVRPSTIAKSDIPVSKRIPSKSVLVKRETRSKSRKNGKKAEKKNPEELGTFDDSMDPIMRTKLGKHVFEFKRPNGKTVLYNADTLVDYMLITGDFCEPVSRLPFTDDDLRRLDRVVLDAGFTKEKVTTAKRKVKKYAELEFRRDALLGLERCAGQLACQMLDIIENVVTDTIALDDGEAQLLLESFPSFMHHFISIRKADPEMAKHCLSQYNSFIRGPPNRPTSNKYGIRDVVLRFLDQVGSGECSGNEFGVTPA